VRGCQTGEIGRDKNCLDLGENRVALELVGVGRARAWLDERGSSEEKTFDRALGYGTQREDDRQTLHA
jgi:hypothetical protein